MAVSGMLLTFALALLIEAALDVAHAFVLRSQLTAIADDAALAGASRIDVEAWRRGRLELDPQAAEQAAETALSTSPGLGPSSVSANARAVSISVSESFATAALRLVGMPRFEVSATATATPRTP